MCAIATPGDEKTWESEDNIIKAPPVLDLLGPMTTIMLYFLRGMWINSIIRKRALRGGVRWYRIRFCRFSAEESTQMYSELICGYGFTVKTTVTG